MIKNGEVSRKNLCETIGKAFYKGMLPSRAYRIIDKCLEKYKFDAECIYGFLYGKRFRNPL